jgi:hypothetical protein
MNPHSVPIKSPIFSVGRPTSPKYSIGILGQMMAGDPTISIFILGSPICGDLFLKLRFKTMNLFICIIHVACSDDIQQAFRTLQLYAGIPNATPK